MTLTRYYRGYNLKQNPLSGIWSIYWGDFLGSKPTLAEAEALVDSWLDAR